MNGIHQDDCIYVHDSSSSPVICRDCSEGTLIYYFQYKKQECGYSDTESLTTEGLAAGLKALIVVALYGKFMSVMQSTKPIIPEHPMDIKRLMLAVVLPPAAVMNKEAGTIMLTGLLTVFGWVPGVVAALVMIAGEKRTPKRMMQHLHP